MQPHLFNESKTLHYFNILKRNIEPPKASILSVISNNIFNIIPFILFIIFALYLHFKYIEKKKMIQIVEKKREIKAIIDEKKNAELEEIERQKNREIEKFYDTYNKENVDEIDIDFIVDPLEYNLSKKNQKNKKDILQHNENEYHILN